MSSIPASVHYEWRAQGVDGKIYKRYLHQIEFSNALNSQYDALSCMLSGATVTFSEPVSHGDVLETLKHAWQIMRHEAPIIAVCIQEETIQDNHFYSFLYAVPSAGELEEWVQKTVHWLEDPMNATTFRAKVLAQRELLIAGKGHYAGHLFLGPNEEEENSFHVGYAANHSVTDVRGSFGLLDRLFQIVSEGALGRSDLDWGSEVKRLYPCLTYAAGLRSDGDETPSHLGAVQEAGAQQAKSFKPSCCFKVKATGKALQPCELPFYKSLTLDETRHRRILEAGKRNGTSITGTVAGIFAAVTYKHNISSDPKSVEIWGAATDRRARLSKHFLPYYGQAIWSKNVLLKDMPSIGKASDALFERGEVTPEFWKICRDFKEDLDAFAKDDESLAISNDLVTGGAFSKGDPATIYPPEFFYSSYGKIDNILSPEQRGSRYAIHIDEPHCMAHFANVATVAISSSAWKGSLELFSQHSRDFYEEREVDAMYEDIAHCFEATESSV